MDAPTQDDVQKLARREVMRHAIPHKYDTIDRWKMQEENARKIDKSLTMYERGVNGRAVKALPFQTLFCHST